MLNSQAFGGTLSTMKQPQKGMLCHIILYILKCKFPQGHAMKSVMNKVKVLKKKNSLKIYMVNVEH